MADIPRIYSPPAAGAKLLTPAPGPIAPSKVSAADQPYLAKLMTMFPAEAVTVYTLGSKSQVNPFVVLMVTLVAMLMVRWAAFRSKQLGTTNPAALFVSAVSFLLWVSATDDNIYGSIHALFAPIFVVAPVTAYQAAAAFLIMVWTWVMPNFVKLDPA